MRIHHGDFTRAGLVDRRKRQGEADVPGRGDGEGPAAAIVITRGDLIRTGRDYQASIGKRRGPGAGVLHGD